MRATALAAQPATPNWGSIRYPKTFVFAVTGFVLVAFGRVHEVLPVLQPFRLGMLSSILVVILAFNTFKRSLVSQLTATPIFKGLMVVVILSVLTIPTAAWPRASFDFVTKVYYTPVILLLVTALTFADRRAMRAVLVAVVATAAVAGLLSLKAPAGRYQIGYSYDPNDTAAFFLMCIPWAIYMVATEKGRLRWLALAAIPFCLVGILKTGSRGALLSTGALVPFLLYLAPPKRRGPFIALIGLAAIVTTASVGDRTWYRLRMAFDTDEYNYTTEDGRIEIWKRGLKYIATAPIQGVGIDGFPIKELASKTDKGFGVRQAAAHNMYIQVAAELGLIGFGGFMAMLLGGMAICQQLSRRAKKWIMDGGGRLAEQELLRANMAAASLFSCMCTGFFLSMGYSSMVYFAVGSAAGVWLASSHRDADGGTPTAAPREPRVVPRGMRGWRSARPVPSSPAFHASERPLS